MLMVFLTALLWIVGIILVSSPSPVAVFFGSFVVLFALGATLDLAQRR